MTPVRLAVILLALVMVGGCTDTYVPRAEPSFYRNLAQPGAELDATTAASMISGYRANNGLPAVSLDPELMLFAQAQTEIMAKRDKLDHGTRTPFAQRLKASCYDGKTAAVYITAANHTRHGGKPGAMTPRLQPKTSVPDTKRWQRHFQAGATRPRIVPICYWLARRAWVSQRCTRQRQNTKSIGH